MLTCSYPAILATRNIAFAPLARIKRPGTWMLVS
jgi:hypothetical protein